MKAADEMRADIQQAKDEIKGIIKRFSEKHGIMEIEIEANQFVDKEIDSFKKIFRVEVKINVKL